MFEPPVSTPISRMIAHRGVAHALVLLVGERHRRRDGDRVAGVHAHRIEVLDRADDDDVVRARRASPRARTPSSRAPISSISTSWTRRLVEAAARPARRTPRGCRRCRRPMPPIVKLRPQDRREADLVDGSRAPRRAMCDEPLRGTSRPICAIACLNSSRSSAFSIAVGAGADQLDAVLLEHAALVRSAIARLSAVWPPSVGSSASGRLARDDLARRPRTVSGST